MAQDDPFAGIVSFDEKPVPVQRGTQPKPIVTDPNIESEQERKRREEERDIARLGITQAGEARDVTQATIKNVGDLRKEFNSEPLVRNFREVEGATRQIVGLASRTTDTPGPTDIALIISYMKALDPGSVVREGEFATAENAGGVPATIRNFYNKVVEGGRISPDIRKAFADTAVGIYNTRRDQYDQFAETYRGLLQDIGADPDRQGVRLSDAIEMPGRPSPLEGTGERQAEVTGEGETFLTAEDREMQSRLNAAYQSGANLGELQAIAQEYNRAFPIPTQEALDQARSEGRAISVQPSGVRSEASKLLGAVGESEVGAYFAGAANALLSGTMDELAPVLGLDADVVQAAKEKLREDYPVSSFAGEVTGQAAQLAAGGAGAKALGAGAKGIAGLEVAQGAAYGAGEANEDRLTGALLGGGAAVVGQQIGKKLFGSQVQQDALQKAAEQAGVPREVLEETLAQAVAKTGRAPRGSIVSTAQEAVEAGAREGVPVLTTDIKPPKTWFGRWLQGTGEKLPLVGTGEIRAKQQAAREAMIENLYEQYSANPAIIDDVTLDFIETRKGVIGKYTQQKKDVFSGLAGAPPPASAQAIQVLDDAIARYGGTESYRPLVAKLQGWKSDLQAARGIADVEDIRKSIGDTFNDTSMESVSSAMRDVTNGPEGLYSALRNDMGDYIKDNAGGAQFAKWQDANAKLADFADDLGKSTVDRLLKTGDATPEEAAKLLFSRKPSDVRALVKNLSPKGKERAQALVALKLIDDAGGVEEISTARFRNALKRSADTFGVIFPKQEAERFTGMLRLLQVTKRAEQAGVTTPTGQAIVPFAGASTAGYFIGDLFGAAGVGGLSAASFRAYESKPMRNLLMQLAKTEKGSKAEGNVLRNINSLLAKSGVTVGAVSTQSPEQQPTSTIEVR